MSNPKDNDVVIMEEEDEDVDVDDVSTMQNTNSTVAAVAVAAPAATSSTADDDRVRQWKHLWNWNRESRDNSNNRSKGKNKGHRLKERNSDSEQHDDETEEAAAAASSSSSSSSRKRTLLDPKEGNGNATTESQASTTGNNNSNSNDVQKNAAGRASHASAVEVAPAAGAAAPSFKQDATSTRTMAVAAGGRSNDDAIIIILDDEDDDDDEEEKEDAKKPAAVNTAVSGKANTTATASATAAGGANTTGPIRRFQMDDNTFIDRDFEAIETFTEEVLFFTFGMRVLRAIKSVRGESPVCFGRSADSSMKYYMKRAKDQGVFDGHTQEFLLGRLNDVAKVEKRRSCVGAMKDELRALGVLQPLDQGKDTTAVVVEPVAKRAKMVDLNKKDGNATTDMAKNKELDEKMPVAGRALAATAPPMKPVMQMDPAKQLKEAPSNATTSSTADGAKKSTAAPFSFQASPPPSLSLSASKLNPDYSRCSKEDLIKRLERANKHGITNHKTEAIAAALRDKDYEMPTSRSSSSVAAPRPASATAVAAKDQTRTASPSKGIEVSTDRGSSVAGSQPASATAAKEKTRTVSFSGPKETSKSDKLKDVVDLCDGTTEGNEEAVFKSKEFVVGVPLFRGRGEQGKQKPFKRFTSFLKRKADVLYTAATSNSSDHSKGAVGLTVKERSTGVTVMASNGNLAGPVQEVVYEHVPGKHADEVKQVETTIIEEGTSLAEPKTPPVKKAKTAAAEPDASKATSAAAVPITGAASGTDQVGTKATMTMQTCNATKATVGTFDVVVSDYSTPIMPGLVEKDIVVCAKTAVQEKDDFVVHINCGPSSIGGNETTGENKEAEVTNPIRTNIDNIYIVEEKKDDDGSQSENQADSIKVNQRPGNEDLPGDAEDTLEEQFEENDLEIVDATYGRTVEDHDLIDISVAKLFVVIFPLLALAGVFWKIGLVHMPSSILVGCGRTFVQLSMLGTFLAPIFKHGTKRPFIIAGYALFMIVMAAYEASSRTKYTFEGQFYYIFGSLVINITLVGALAFGIVIKPQPMWNARYVLPIVGMLLGNSINGISLSLDSITTSLVEDQAEIELYLSFGASKYEAVSRLWFHAIQKGATPVLNMMRVVGLLSIPGMMTGQILGGSPAHVAARYQMLIIFLIALCTLSTILVNTVAAVEVAFCQHEILRPERLVTNNKKSLLGLLVWLWGGISSMGRNDVDTSSLSPPAWSPIEQLEIPSPRSTRGPEIRYLQESPDDDFNFPILEASNLVRTFAAHKGQSSSDLSTSRVLFHNISFNLYRGDVVQVAGPSGAGKSQLLRTIAGLTPLEEPGRMEVDMLDYDDYYHGGHSAEWRKMVRYIPQHKVQIPGTPMQFIKRIGTFATWKKDEIRMDHLAFYLDQWGLSAAECLEKEWSILSGGEAQRILVGLALSSHPKVLLFDESTASLDRASKMLVEKSIQEYGDYFDGAILWVSHDEQQNERMTSIPPVDTPSV